MSGTSRILWSLLLCCGLALAQGCDDGDGEGNGNTDTGVNDAGNDTGETDAGNDTGGGSCGLATECSGNADCEDTEFCQAGCCTERPTASSCTVAGDTCEGADWSNDNFVCNQEAAGAPGECLARCSADAETSADPGGCSAGSWCFEVDGDPVVNPAGTALDGVCLEGDCNEVGADGSYSCDDGAGTCYAFGNNASFCITAGTQAVGDSCIPGAGDAGETCAAGLLCYQGSCIEPCQGNGDCTGDEECIAVFDQTGNNSPGACAAPCGPFSEGQCPEGTVCDINVGPYTGNLTEWACRELDGDAAVVGFGEECDADDTDGFDTQCGEGLVCVPGVVDETVGECQQLCDPTGDVMDDFGSCAVGSGATIGDTATDEGATSDYVTTNAATYTSLTANGDETIEGDAATFGEATSNTVVAYVDADGEYALGVYEDGDAGSLDEDEALVQVYNTSGTTLDVYSLYVLTTDLEVGGIETATDIDPAADYQSLDGEAFTYLGGEREAGEIYDIILHGIAGDETTPLSALWLPFEAPTYEADSGAYRVVHASPTAGGVYLDGDLAYGEATDWIAAAAGEVSIELLDGEGGDEVATIDITVEADTAYTVVVYDGEGLASLTITQDAEADDDSIALVVANVSDASAPYGIGEPVFTDVVDTASAGVMEAEWGLIFGDAAAEAGDEPLVLAEAATTAGEMLSILVGWDDSETPEPAVWTLEGDYPDVDGLADGEALVRVWNIAWGAGALLLETPGEVLQVCAALALEGLGRCVDICNPYPGGEFADGSGESNGRWESNGCPHDDDVIYGCIALEAPGFETTCATTPPPGACFGRPADSATGGFGDSCNSDDDCNPDAFCAADANGNGVCSKLCLPNNPALATDCGEGEVCSAAVSTVVSICVEPGSDSTVGEACAAGEEFEACADDNSICLAVSATDFECVATCTMDCDGSCPATDTETRSTCSRQFAPDFPAGLGFCPIGG